MKNNSNNTLSFIGVLQIVFIVLNGLRVGEELYS